MTDSAYVTKQFVGGYRLWKDGEPTLSHLDVELTERCNNNCIHCNINLPADDLKARKKELPTNRLKQILQEAAALGCRSARFTGGEPLLREDFEELYIFTRRLGIQVIIYTNATLITSRLAELFARIHPLQNIEVSFYGMKKSSYERVTRAPGSFEAAQRGVSLLLEHKVCFVVKGALLPANKEELEEFDAWAGAVSWMNDSPSYSMFFDLHCRRDQRKNQLIKSVRISPEEGLKVLARRGDAYLENINKFCSKFIGVCGDGLFSCDAGVIKSCVDAYGILQPCILLRHPDCVYDLKKGSLKDAMINFFPQIRKKKAVNKQYLARCARCFLKGLCEQCPAKAWMEHGTLDTPVKYLCEIAHAQARFTGLVGKNEMAWEVKNWRERIKNRREGGIYAGKGRA